MEIIDTHCHIDVEEFNSDREQVLSRCQDNGVSQIIVPAINAQGWNSLIELTKKFCQLRPALGLHPVFISQHQLKDLDVLEDLIRQKKPVAVGEIGLDFFVENTDREKQLHFFEQQLYIASRYNLPVILHIRKAHNEVIRSLKKFKLNGGTCHAFNGSLQQANEYIRMGFKLGFGGTMTFPNANKIHELARTLPLESIVLETDAPDMSGFLHRGQRNSPEYLPEALNALAQLRKIEPEIAAEITTQNAIEVFRLGKY